MYSERVLFLHPTRVQDVLPHPLVNNTSTGDTVGDGDRWGYEPHMTVALSYLKHMYTVASVVAALLSTVLSSGNDSVELRVSVVRSTIGYF